MDLSDESGESGGIIKQHDHRNLSTKYVPNVLHINIRKVISFVHHIASEIMSRLPARFLTVWVWHRIPFLLLIHEASPKCLVFKHVFP
jgi:hypothetical protein